MKLTPWLILFIPFTVYSQLKFKSAASLLSPVEYFSGSVVGISDMDGDGHDDIIRLQSARNLSIEYQTAPGMPFKHRSLGQIAPYEFWNISIADINQDGFNDMVFTANENLGYIYYSQKTGDSINYQTQVLNGSNGAYAQGANLADINNDGWLDYFLCSDLGENKIWANDGKGKIDGNPVPWIDFKSIPPSDNSGNYGSIWSDLDNDGDLDLYVAKCKSGVTDPKDPRRVNTFFKNTNGSFTESAASSGLAIGDQSWTAVPGDIDNDGDLDLYIINHFTSSNLMINDGKGNFNDAFTQSGINYSAFGIQAAWADLDNDGWLDLILSGSAHQIYRNKGQNKFELFNTSDLGIAPIESFSIGDLNQDGKIDIYASYSQVVNAASHRPDVLWLNDINTNNHYLNVRLTGNQSNKSAVGAKIILVNNGMRQTREIYAGLSYGISSSLTLHFGIGTANKIDSLIILWPNGTKETIESPTIDRTLIVKQNTCFSFDPIITPTPDKNLLCNSMDSISLTAPVTGNYHWSDGRTSRSIVIKSPGTYGVSIVTAMGCEIHSNYLAIDVDHDIRYHVQQSDSVVCEGSEVTLNLPLTEKITWNTGDTGQIIKVKTTGKYFASIQNSCSVLRSDTLFVRVITLPPVIVKNDTILPLAKANLMAQGISIQWFSELVGGMALASGNNYITPSLSQTTTYYAQSILTTIGTLFSAGIKDFVSPSKFHANTFSGKLFFDAAQNCILKSVKVYADTSAVREIDLLDAAGKIVYSKVIKIEVGENTIPLDFNISPGLSLSLTTNDEASINVFATKSPRLYRTEGIIPYPIKSGPITIYGTNAGLGNYYYFYDWKLAFPDLVCQSPRTPVQGVIKTVAIKNELLGKVFVYPNPLRQNLFIDVSGLSFNSLTKLQLLNSIGQIKISRLLEIKSNVIEMDLKEPPGVYFLKLENSGKTGVIKLVVQ
ncbi:MAG: FG-GAP-like repeat-containing protein [Saprospiraceae bacterium]